MSFHAGVEPGILIIILQMNEKMCLIKKISAEY